MAGITERKARLRELWSDTSWEDAAAFIGPNAGRFRKAWEKQRMLMLDKGGGIAWSFCWPALLLSFVWFFYRKQWFAGAVILILPPVLAYLLPGSAGSFVGIDVALAMMAKSVYMHDVVSKIAKVKAAGGDSAAIAAAGGISWPAGIAS